MSLRDSPRATPAKVLGDVTAKIPPNSQEISNAPPRARAQRLTSKRVSGDLFSRTRLQCFLSDPPRSSYKKLIISTPRLVQALRMMLIAKAVPKGIKDHECKRFALRECPPVLYVPEKDPVQETVSLLKSDQSLKMTIRADAELRLPIWHWGAYEVFLMHVSSALDAIEKRGTFKAHKEAHEAYVEQRNVAKQVKADMGLFASKGEKATKKGTEKASATASGKNRSEKEKAPQKTKEGVALSNATAPDLCEEYKALYEKVVLAKETVKSQKETTATKMFQFYANLVSLDAKYAWNKIVQEQMEADPYKDLKGVSRKGPRGLSQESFDDCVMFHLLTVFPNNAAEQEKYYLSNVLKKPQQVSIRQFVQRVEQLNPYVAQLPCWYYSPSYVTRMTPVNVPFMEADLASHILQMCLHQWQDQYNLQEKGMTPMDMRTLQASLKAIERVCTHEKAPALSGEKASHKNEAGAKQPSTGATIRVPKKVRFEKSCELFKKYGGMHTTHATKDCRKYEKDGTVKADFRAAKKAGKKPNPAKQLFTQLSKKLDRLEKTIKKASHKSKKRRRDNSNSDSE